jgi:DNA-binding transcriptional ArsR family regulator
MENGQAVKALAALSQENRLAIFRRLVVAGAEGMTPGDLSEALDMPPATLSFHLKELFHAGLLRRQKERRFLHYRVDFTTMNALVGYLVENCCRGESCGVNVETCHTDHLESA